MWKDQAQVKHHTGTTCLVPSGRVGLAKYKHTNHSDTVWHFCGFYVTSFGLSCSCCALATLRLVAYLIMIRGSSPCIIRWDKFSISISYTWQFLCWVGSGDYWKPVIWSIRDADWKYVSLAIPLLGRVRRLLEAGDLGDLLLKQSRKLTILAPCFQNW